MNRAILWAVLAIGLALIVVPLAILGRRAATAGQELPA
jgi:hypothetical protein